MSDGSAHRSSPPMYTLPEVGRLMPLKCEISVDLPQPVEPMTPTNAPSSISKLTRSSATVSSGMP